MPDTPISDELVERAIDAAVAALPPRWQRGMAQKDYERSDVEPIVRAALSASPVQELVEAADRLVRRFDAGLQVDATAVRALDATLAKVRNQPDWASG